MLAGTGKPAFGELLELQTQGHASPIGSSLLPSLDAVVAVMEQWLQRCGKTIARRSAQTPRTCLEAMAASVQRAQEQMESQLRKLQASIVALLPRTLPDQKTGYSDRL